MVKWIDIIAAILLVAGGLNWGIIGVAGTNIIESLFGVGAITTTIYILVGLAAIWQAIQWKQIQRRW